MMAKGAAKYFLSLGCSVLVIDPTQPSCTGCHSFPLECVEAASKWLRQQGNTKIGMAGGSTTGMLSLVAAAYIPDISLVLAYTPCDFVMQGFFKGKKDGHIPEWPAPGKSAVTWRGEPVPYAPYDMPSEDDTLWFTARYIRRMERRLKERGFSFRFEPHIYEKGIHFIFPQGMMRRILPVGCDLLSKVFVSGRKYPGKCRAARIDVDRATVEAVRRW